MAIAVSNNNQGGERLKTALSNAGIKNNKGVIFGDYTPDPNAGKTTTSSTNAATSANSTGTAKTTTTSAAKMSNPTGADPNAQKAHEIKTRDAIKNRVYSLTGKQVSDSDITYTNSQNGSGYGQVYYKGNLVGTPDYIDENGNSYFDDASSFYNTLDKYIDQDKSDKFYNAYNDAVNTGKKAFENNQSNRNDTYGLMRDYYTDGDKLDSSTEEALRSIYGAQKTSGENDTMASGSARNGGNIDSLSIQNRANYDAAVNARYAEAYLNALNQQYERNMGKLNALGTYNNDDSSAQNAYNEAMYNYLGRLYDKDKLDKDYDLNKQEQNRSDKQLEYENALDNAGIKGWTSSLDSNPYLNTDGTLNAGYTNIDFTAMYNAEKAKYEQAKTDGDTLAMTTAHNNMNWAAEAYQAKTKLPEYAQYAGQSIYSDGQNWNSSDWQAQMSDKTDNAQIASNEKVSLAQIENEWKMSKLDNDTALAIAKIEQETGLSTAEIEAATQKYVANTNAQATVDAATIQAAVDKYGYDTDYNGTVYSKNADTVKENGGLTIFRDEPLFSGLAEALGIYGAPTASQIATYLNDKSGIAGAVKPNDDNNSFKVNQSDAQAIKDTINSDDNLTDEDKALLISWMML